MSKSATDKKKVLKVPGIDANVKGFEDFVSGSTGGSKKSATPATVPAVDVEPVIEGETIEIEVKQKASYSTADLTWLTDKRSQEFAPFTTRISRGTEKKLDFICSKLKYGTKTQIVNDLLTEYCNKQLEECGIPT